MSVKDEEPIFVMWLIQALGSSQVSWGVDGQRVCEGELDSMFVYSATCT